MAVGTTVYTNTEKKNKVVEKNVWERKIVYGFVDNDTTKTPQTIKINGVLQKIMVLVGTATDGGATCTVAVTDNDDNDVFSAAALADATLHAFNVSEPLSGEITVNVTPTDPGGAWTITVWLRGV